MEAVGMPQDTSLQVTEFEGCDREDPPDLKEAAMCGAVEKQAGNF